MQTENRREPRFGLSSATLPFLGTLRNDYQPFQYIVQDISRSGIRIAIPNWVQLREVVQDRDLVRLHVPFSFHGRAHDRGLVAWHSWDESIDGLICGIALQARSPLAYPVHISLASQEIDVDMQDFQGTEELALRVLSDSLLIKRGLMIYLKHLNAYFLRASLVGRKDYLAFRELIMDDLTARVQTNYDGLLTIHEQVAKEKGIEDTFLRVFDLEGFRSLIEPEIYIEIFKEVLSLEAVELYLRAIKVLEERLYLNFNTIVLLYLRSLVQMPRPDSRSPLDPMQGG